MQERKRREWEGEGRERRDGGDVERGIWAIVFSVSRRTTKPYIELRRR